MAWVWDSGQGSGFAPAGPGLAGVSGGTDQQAHGGRDGRVGVTGVEQSWRGISPGEVPSPWQEPWPASCGFGLKASERIQGEVMRTRRLAVKTRKVPFVFLL